MRLYSIAAAAVFGAIVGATASVACPNFDAPYPGPLGAFAFGANDTPQPYTNLSVGGPFSVADCNLGPVGYVSQEPTLTFEWFGGEQLFIDTEGLNGTDTVVLVQAPNGVTHFNDDYASGNLDGAIELTGPRAPAGVYRVWVGTYGSQPGTANLNVQPQILR